MSLDDAIKAAEEAAQRLREALDALDDEAVAELGSAPLAATYLKKQVAEMTLGGVRRAAAEARRAKGPSVTLELVGGLRSSADRTPLIGEVIQRTKAQVVVRTERGTDYYKLKDGKPARSGTSGFYGYWRVREADLPAIREMPVGENAVSRALKAIEAGRYDEVKR
ncbi:hypothetical protein WMF30_10160 [Sorangium sp. So ce134]